MKSFLSNQRGFYIIELIHNTICKVRMLQKSQVNIGYLVKCEKCSRDEFSIFKTKQKKSGLDK